MSATRAEKLPAVPAALPQDSARTRAAAHWTGTVLTPLAAPEATAPDQATRPEPAPDQATRPRVTRTQSAKARPAQTQAAQTQAAQTQAAQTQAAQTQAAQTQATGVPLRLTRRGRVVVTIAAALLLAMLSLVIAASAQATNHPLPSRAGQQNLAQVTVRPGQSLWSVAETADPGADTRVVIQQIIELNGLTGTAVFVGQRLWVPRG